MNKSFPDALIFDFDGVVVDSEPVHLACFRQVLLEAKAVELSREDYYSKYLGYDDRDCFAAVMASHGRAFTDSDLGDMIAAKTRLVQERFGKSIQALPGAVELIRAAKAAGLPLAICSGALRKEIELASRCIGVLECFGTIVSAEDVARGKPDPEGYRKARRQLSQVIGRELAAERCVVMEDSPAGIEAAHGAGMKVLAVTTSYEAKTLAQADRVVKSLADADVASLGRMV